MPVCQSMFIGTARGVASLGRIHFKRLLWLLRGEVGEMNGRFHYHALFAGLPPYMVADCNSDQTCLAVMSLWERIGGGIARCRVYDPGLNGVDYCLKGLKLAELAGSNFYEMGKFRAGCDVTISESVACDRTSLLRKRTAFATRRWLGGTRVQH